MSRSHIIGKTKCSRFANWRYHLGLRPWWLAVDSLQQGSLLSVAKWEKIGTVPCILHIKAFNSIIKTVLNLTSCSSCLLFFMTHTHTDSRQGLVKPTSLLVSQIHESTHGCTQCVQIYPGSELWAFPFSSSIVPPPGPLLSFWCKNVLLCVSQEQWWQ